MMVEDRVRIDKELDKFYVMPVSCLSSDMIVEEGRHPMWETLRRTDEAAVLPPNSLVVLRAMKSYLCDENEY